MTTTDPARTPEPEPESHRHPLTPIEWIGDATTGHLRLLDQTRLPRAIHYLDCREVKDVWTAIRQLSVRGAPAIGIAAAYGCVLGAQRGAFDEASEFLTTSRPTAVNLFWAVARMRRAMQRHSPSTTPRETRCAALLDEARAIHDEDRRACRSIGEHALRLLRELTHDDLRLLTHCNAGMLATGGIGTATSPMYLAHEQHLPLKIFADETRPLLQGSRLTAFELQHAGIDVTLITDSMAATVLRDGQAKAVITGADRIAANGDVANKIGTYPLAVLASHHGLPFIVAAPTSTFDLDTPTGEAIPIEERAADEITEGFGERTAPQDIQTYAPAFDVTPASLITALVTEHGVIRPVHAAAVRHHLEMHRDRA